MIGSDVPAEWSAAAVPVGCALTALVLVSRFWDVLRYESQDDPAAVYHAITAQYFAALVLFLVGIISIASIAGPAATGMIVQEVFSGFYFAAISMLALAGELARVVNAELGIRRLVQSIFAGARSAPVAAPIIAASMQGPLLMRSGRSFEGEIAREASEMLNVMERQGVERGLAWNALAAGGACALVLPSSLGLIAAAAFEITVDRIWIAMIVPGVILATALALIAIASHARRVGFILRRSSNHTPLFVLYSISSGILIPAEVGGFVALSGFAVAFAQPVRPRLKDILTAVQRSVVVVGDLAFSVASASTIVFVFDMLHWTPAAHPSAWTIVLCGLLLPALLAFLFDVPVALVLSSVSLPLLATVSKTHSVPSALQPVMMIICAALIGTLMRACLLPPPVLELRLAPARVWSACWAIPFLLVWILVLLAPQIVLAIYYRVFGF